MCNFGFLGDCYQKDKEIIILIMLFTQYLLSNKKGKPIFNLSRPRN